MLKPRRRQAILLLMAAALFAGVIATASYAQAPEPSGEQQLINIDVKEAPVEQVLRMLAKAANVNILVGPDVKGTVESITLRDVSVEAALRLIAKSQGFYWYKDDNVYVVSKQAPPAGTGGVEAAVVPTAPAAPAPIPQPAVAVPAPIVGGATALPAIGPGAPVLPPPTYNVAAPTAPPAPEPQIVQAMIVLKHADAQQLAYMFGGTSCEGGSLQGRMASSPAPSSVRKALSRGSRGLATADVFGGGYGTPSAGSGSALGWGQDFGGGMGGGGRGGGRGGGGSFGGTGGGGQFGGGSQFGGTSGMGGAGGSGVLGSMLPGGMSPPVAFLPQNALLVQGTQQDIDKFREILDMLDKPAKQVEIATKFIEVQTTADRALGIDWSISSGNLEVFNVGFAPAEAANNVVRFARGQLEALLTALQSSGRATVINEPHVITANNQFAEINFYTQIPYFSATVNYNQFGTREVDFTSDFIDVENSLWVVPRINADDSVTVYLEPTLEDTVGEVEGPNGERIPIVTSQYVSTQVRVGDGETIVLGGLIRKDESTTLRETPLLSRIPIIGKLFRGQRVNKRNSELLIFVTPRIVRDIPAQ